jgi:hypothetical protein
VGRIKGTAMVSVVKSLKVMGKDKAAAVLAPALHHYLEERVLPSSWYPEEDHLVLLRALGGLLEAGIPNLEEDVFVWMGRNSAQTDMSTVYASLVQTASPESIFRRGATLWQAYHDSGSLQVTMVTPNKGTVELVDYAHSAPEMCRVMTGWFSGFLQTGGAKGIRVTETSCKHKGGAGCVWEAQWA